MLHSPYKGFKKNVGLLLQLFDLDCVYISIWTVDTFPCTFSQATFINDSCQEQTIVSLQLQGLIQIQNLILWTSKVQSYNITDLLLFLSVFGSSLISRRGKIT